MSFLFLAVRRRQTLPKSKSARQLIEENWRKQSIDYKSYELESLKKQIAEMQAEHDRKIREKGKSNQIFSVVWFTPKTTHNDATNFRPAAMGFSVFGPELNRILCACMGVWD